MIYIGDIPIILWIFARYISVYEVYIATYGASNEGACWSD